jgi:16S rRNA (cytosine1402-N4)-methyltransferase
MIASVLVAGCREGRIKRTSDLAQLLLEASQPGKKSPEWKLHPTRGKWNTHPAARTFQVLRILVNRERPSLEQLLRMLPSCLKPGGRAAVISFHSGEDRLVKASFRAYLEAGLYSSIAPGPVRASEDEKRINPRSRSAKLRWAVRAT